MSKAHVKIHSIAIVAIIFLLVLIAYLSRSTGGPTVDKGYAVAVSSATYNTTCATPAVKSSGFTSEKNISAKDNVLSAVSSFCNGKLNCTLKVDAQALGITLDSPCSKELKVEYRCFSYDRPWYASAPDGQMLEIDCSKRGAQ